MSWPMFHAIFSRLLGGEPTYNLPTGFLFIGSQGGNNQWFYTDPPFTRIPDPVPSTEGGINCTVTWHPDGRRVLYGLEGGGAYLFDIGAAIDAGHPFNRHRWQLVRSHTGSTVRSAAFSPDGQYYVINSTFAAAADRVQVYNTETGERVALTGDAPAQVNEVDWSPDGSTIVAALQNSPYISIWDTSTWTRRVTDPPTIPTSAAGKGRFSPDGSLFAIGSSTGNRLIIYNTSDWSVAAIPATQPAGQCTHISWKRDGSLLCFGASTATPKIVIYDTADWSVHGTINPPSATSTSWSEFNGNTDELFICQNNGSQRFQRWSTATYTQLPLDFDYTVSIMGACRLHPTLPWLAIAGNGEGCSISSLEERDSTYDIRRIGAGSSMYGAMIQNKQYLLVHGGNGGTRPKRNGLIKLDPRTYDRLDSPFGSFESVNKIALSPDRKFLGFARSGSSADFTHAGYYTLPDFVGPTFLSTRSGGSIGTTGNDVKFSPDGAWMIVVTNSNPWIHVYRTGIWQRRSVSGPSWGSGIARGVAFNPAGTRCVVVGDTAGQMRVYRVPEWSPAESLDVAPNGACYGVCFSPDGTVCVVGTSSSPYIAIYDTRTDPWTRLATPTNPLTTGGGRCAFSPDGNYLLLGSSGGTQSRAWQIVDLHDPSTWVSVTPPDATNIWHSIVFGPEYAVPLTDGAPEIVQFVAASGTTFASADNQDQTIPTETEADDLIVGFVMARGVVTAPTGWNFVDEVEFTDGTIIQRVAVYTRTAEEGDAGTVQNWQQSVTDQFSVHYQVYRKSGDEVPTIANILKWNLDSVGGAGSNVATWPDETATRYGQVICGAASTIISGTVTATTTVGTRTTPTGGTANNRMCAVYLECVEGDLFSGTVTWGYTPTATLNGRGSISLLLE